jgi:hypothetical protein
MSLTLMPVLSMAQLAENYPNDIGIEHDPHVRYVERFEGSLDQIFSRYTDILYPNGIFLDPDVPPGSLSAHSIRMNSAPGVNTGAHLFRNFQPGFDGTVHVRYYVKYPKSSQYYFHHEGIWFGGYNPSTPWPSPGAGLCGMGDKRLSIAFEPVWHDTDPPGMDTYLYWGDMKSWNGGTSCFGNVTVTQGATGYSEPLVTGDYPGVALDEWMCIEIMIKLNDPVSAYNGELAIWVDGVQIGHWGPGFPNGHWLKDKWYNNPADPLFEGFRWRTHPALNINWLWIEYFHSNPTAPPSHIHYDHVVVADKYIGPIHQPTGTDVTLPRPSDDLRIYPSPLPEGAALTIRLAPSGWSEGDKSLEVTDMTGSVVFSARDPFVGGAAQVVMPNLSPGMYILRVRDASWYGRAKFLVQRP